MPLYSIGMQKESKSVTDFIKQNQGYANMKQLKAYGFNTKVIKDSVNKGIVEKIKAGLYRNSDIEPPAGINIGFIDITKAYKECIICLISALEYYNLTMFNPSSIYVAVRHNKRNIKILYPPVEIFYFRERYYEIGINIIETPFGNIKIYDREKSICDMFRFRNKLGEDIAYEALKNYVKSDQTDFNKLREYAEITNVKLVLTPILKTLVG
jgi:predicted transcriptional regulator of viral defense system